MEIRLFKTTVISKAIVSKLAPELNAILKGMKWNFDLSDCDKVLRIEASQIPLQKIVEMMNQQQHQITEIF